jgi:UDP-galactopyranose mutase
VTVPDGAPWDVVFFSSVDYVSHAQRPQAVARELAARGARVLYIDNLGLRLPRLSDRRRIVRRVRSAREPVAPGPITVVSPLVPPLEQRGPVRAIARRRLLDRIEGWRSNRPAVVWTYLPNPVIGDVAESMRAAAVVYEYADLASVRLHVRSTRHRARVAAWEDAMFRRADVVFVPNERLSAARGIASANVHVIPHGSPPENITHASAWLSESVPHPRIAFVGSVSEVVDVALLDGVALAHPDWSFVVAGPARAPIRSLRQRCNVVVTGEISPDEVSAILDECDVGVIPYRCDQPGIDTVSPLKLGDYRAHGLPVVSVDIPEVRGRDGVEIAAGIDGFGAAIGRALAEGRGPGERGATWADAVGAMVDLVRTTVS